MTTPIWSPSPERVQASHLHRWAGELRARYGFAEGYTALHRWSVEHLETSWEEAWRDAGVAVASGVGHSCAAGAPGSTGAN